MILLIGTIGMVGSEVCRLLSSKDISVKGMVRRAIDNSKRDNLTDPGVQLMDADISDISTFPRLFEGIIKVIKTVSSMPFSYLPGENDIRQVDEGGMINLINDLCYKGRLYRYERSAE